jgi:hypothetical protein
MAVTLQPDPTVADLNAYCSRAEANEYLAERRLFSLVTWEAVTNKDAAIMWATRELDRLNYVGARALSANRHEWPRTGVTDVASTVIPEAVKDATAELAYYLGQNDQSQASDQEKYQEIKAGPITLKFREANTGRELTSEMPDSIRGLLKRYLAGGSIGSLSHAVVRT